MHIWDIVKQMSMDNAEAPEDPGPVLIFQCGICPCLVNERSSRQGHRKVFNTIDRLLPTVNVCTKIFRAKFL